MRGTNTGALDSEERGAIRGEAAGRMRSQGLEGEREGVRTQLHGISRQMSFLLIQSLLQQLRQGDHQQSNGSDHQMREDRGGGKVTIPSVFSDFVSQTTQVPSSEAEATYRCPM
jgi:hypothetical protein